MGMRILHLCLGNAFVDNYSYQENLLTKYHVKMGNDVTVIASLFTFGENGKGLMLPAPSEYVDVNGAHVIRLAFKKPLKWYRFFRRYAGLKETIDRVHPDIIFSHNLSYADTTLVADYVKRHPQVKVFADNHADYINSAKNWASKHILHPIIWRHYAKVLEPYLTRCFGVTPMRCRFLKEMYHIKPELVEFLPMGVDDEAIPLNRHLVREDIRKQLGVPENDILVFTGGKIDKLKNIHLLIEAINELGNDHLHLVICGVLTPEMRYLEETIAANDKIHYLGWCNAERVMNCMVASDFACFPGTHSTLWEQSVGVGLPAVFKRWSEMEHVDINGNCVFVNRDDVSELKKCISLMQDRDFYAEILGKATIAASSFRYSQIAAHAIGS